MESSTIDTNRSSMINSKATLSIALPSAMAQTVTPLHHILHALPLPELPLSVHHTHTECTNLTLNDQEERQTSRAITEAARALSKDDNCMHFLHCAFEHERDKLSSQERQEKLKESECEEEQQEEEEEINKITENKKRSSKATISKVAHDATVSVCHWLEDECKEENELEHENDHHLQLWHANNVRQMSNKKQNATQHASTTIQRLCEHENELAATTRDVMASVQEVKQEIVNGTKTVNSQSKENDGNIAKNKCEREEILKVQSDIDDDDNEVEPEKPTVTIITAAIVQENVNKKNSMLPVQSTEIVRFMSILSARDKYSLEDVERFVKEMIITHLPFTSVVNAEVVTSFVEVLLEECQVTNADQVSNQYNSQLLTQKCNNNIQEEHKIKQENLSERVTVSEFTWRYAVHASALLWTVNRWREHLLLADNITSTDQSKKQEEEQGCETFVSAMEKATTKATTNLPMPAPALRSCVMSTLIDAFYHIVHNTHHLMTKLHNEEMYDDTRYCYNNPWEPERLQNSRVKEECIATNKEVNDKQNTDYNKCMNWRKWAECIRMFARSFAALLRVAYSKTEQITHDVWLINDVECDRIEQICTYSLFCVPTLCEKDTYCEYTSYVMENIVHLYRCVYRYKHDGNDKNVCSGNNTNINDEIENIYPRHFFSHVLPSPHLLEQTWSETILVYSANNLLVKQDSRKVSCMEQRKFSLITICMLSAMQSLFSNRHCSLTEIDATAPSTLAKNKEKIERIIIDVNKLQRTCIAWANALWHHFLCTPNTLYEDKEVLIIRCNVINCIFKELSMLISCPTWPAANLLLHECVNVFSREVHASIARSIACCNTRKYASSRSSKEKINCKEQTKTCKQLENKQMENEDEQLEQEKENLKMLKRNKMSTKNKKKSGTVDKVKKECMCEEDLENGSYKNIKIKRTTDTDEQNAEINKNTDLLHIAVIDAIAQVIIELIIVRSQIRSKYTMKNMYVSKTQLEEESEANDKCLQVFAQYISEPLAKYEHKVQRNTLKSTPMINNDEYNSLHECNEYKNDTKDKSLQTIIEFIFNNMIIERSKRQTGNGNCLGNRSSSSSRWCNDNNNNNIEYDNDTLYQHLLSWISCNNVSNVNEKVSVDKDMSKKSINEIGDSNNYNNTYHTVQNDSMDKECNFMQIALHAMEGAKRKQFAMRPHIFLVNLCEQMLQEVQQEECTTRQKNFVNEIVNEAILVTQLALPESMLSRHVEEQLIYFLLSLLQCSYEANDAKELSNKECIKDDDDDYDDDDDDTNADLCDVNVHDNDDTTTSKENKVKGKRANKHRPKDEKKSKIIHSRKNNWNEQIIIADSIVKRIIYHFTQLCLCDRSMTHFIWSQLKRFVRSSNARIREAVVPLITFLIQDCLSNLSLSQEEYELEQTSLLIRTNCSVHYTQQNVQNNNLLHTQNANFVTEMISTLLYLLEDRSVMVVTRVINSFHILLSILDQLDNFTRHNELRPLQQQQQQQQQHQQSQCKQENNSQCVENITQGDVISAIERDQLLLFIQYKLLKCFAETKHTRHQNDIAHLFVKRWLSMLNTEQDEVHKTNSLENTNSNTINAERNHDNNSIMCYAEQTTPVEFAAKSSLTSHVLNSHAQLAREWMTLITKLATTSSDHSDNRHNTHVAAAPYTAAINKTTRPQYSSTLLLLPRITKEHPFYQLLSLLLNKSCCESRTLPHYNLERARQDLSVRERCHGVTITKANSYNNNINLYTKKKSDFTIEEMEHLLRSICRAVWTRFTCCVSANDAFSCLTTIHVIVMVNASSACQLVPHMLPYLSLSSEQNPLRHSSADLYGGVLLQLCHILQIMFTDGVHCTERKKEVKGRYNNSKNVATLATPNVLASDVDDCHNTSTRHIISKDENNNISKWKSKAIGNTLLFTTLDALSALFNSIIAKYVGVYQQRIIVAACGALTALIPFGEHHPSVEKASMTPSPNQMPTTKNNPLQMFNNIANMNEVTPISPYLLMCYKLMDGYYTRIYLLLPSLSTDYKSIAYIQRFLFLLSEFLRNYRGWTNAALQKQLQDVSDANMYNSFNVNVSSSYNDNNINSNSVAVQAPLTSNSASQSTWEGYLSQDTVAPLASGDGICLNVFALVLKIMRCASADTLIKLQVILMRVMSSLCMLAPQTYFVECKGYITQSLLPEASIVLQIQGLTLLRDFLRDEAERVYLASAPTESSSSTATKPLTASSARVLMRSYEQSTRLHKVDSTVIADNTNITECNNKKYRNRGAKNKLSKSVTLEPVKLECSTEEKHKSKNRNNDSSAKANVSNRRQKHHTGEKHKMQSESESIATNECENKMEDRLQVLSFKFDFADENSGMAAWLMQSYHELIATLCIHSVSKVVRELCIEIMYICANDGLLPPSKYLPSLIALCNDVDGAIRNRAQQFLCKSTEFIQFSESLSVAAVPGILYGYVLSCSCKADVIENISPCASYATMNNVTSSMSYHTLFTLLTYRDRQKVRSALLRYFYETDKLSAWWKNLPLIRDNIEQTNVSKGDNSNNNKSTIYSDNDANADNFVFTTRDNSQQLITQQLNLLSFLMYLSVVITFSSLSNASQLEQTNLCNECITGINLHGESALSILTNACQKLSNLPSEVMLDKVSVASSEGGLAKTHNSQKSMKRSKKEARSRELNLMEEKQQEQEEEYSYSAESTKECTHNNSSDETNAANRSGRQVIAESQCVELLENLSLERLALSEAISVVFLHYIYTTIQHFHSANGMRNKEKSEHIMEFESIAQTNMKINNYRRINSNRPCPSFTAGQVQVALLFLHNARVFTQKIAPLVSCMHVNLADNNAQTEDIHLSHKQCLNNKNNKNKCLNKVNNQVDCSAINEVADALHFLRDELQRTLCDDTLQNMHTSSHRHCIKRTKTSLSSAKTKQSVNKSKLQMEKASKRNINRSQRKRKRSTSSESSLSSESSISTLTSSTYSSDEDDYYSSSSSSSCTSSMSSSD